MQCEEEQSFGQLLSQLGGEQFVEKGVEGVRIEGEGGKHYEVQLDAPSVAKPLSIPWRWKHL